MNEYSQEFKLWYERHFLQSPSLCKLEYDDEKMWEAWKAAKQWQGLIEEEINSLIEQSALEDILMFYIEKPMTALMKKRYELTIKFAKAIEQKLKEKNHG